MTRYTLSNSGTVAFPVWQVWEEPEDEQGFTIEHECRMLQHFTTKKEGLEYIAKIGE